MCPTPTEKMLIFVWLLIELKWSEKLLEKTVVRCEVQSIDHHLKVHCNLARHFPSRIESTEIQLNPIRKPYVCANTARKARSRRDTPYECIECDVGLCLMDRL